jgi:hypothetical protein
MSYRLYESASGALGGCLINPNKYNYNEFIDIDGNKQYIVYHGMKLPLNLITSQQQEFTSSVGIMPNKRVKKSNILEQILENYHLYIFLI